MFNVNCNPAKYTEYCDNVDKHGTAVVEVLNTFLMPETRVYVASIKRYEEKRLKAKIIIIAMEEFHRLKLDVINCSFSGTWDNRRLCDTIKALQVSEMMIIASGGNDGNIECILSDLNNGKSIMVGSHNRGNIISTFSNCKVDICGIDENIFLNYVTSSLRSGTSYAVPGVTAAVANCMSFLLRNDYELIKKRLDDTAEYVLCYIFVLLQRQQQ